MMQKAHKNDKRQHPRVFVKGKLLKDTVVAN